MTWFKDELKTALSDDQIITFKGLLTEIKQELLLQGFKARAAMAEKMAGML